MTHLSTPFPRLDVVLDTHVVLDWLVFLNPISMQIGAAIEAGTLRWLVSEPLRDELAHVLGRGVCQRWGPDEQRLWSTWERWSFCMPHPAQTPAIWPRCTDSDDQKFIDLALTHAHCLLSRDRAVLKVGHRAAKLGLTVTTPERWAAAQLKAAHPAQA
jgi:uncharacterized protein